MLNMVVHSSDHRAVLILGHIGDIADRSRALEKLRDDTTGAQGCGFRFVLSVFKVLITRLFFRHNTQQLRREL